MTIRDISLMAVPDEVAINARSAHDVLDACEGTEGPLRRARATATDRADTAGDPAGMRDSTLRRLLLPLAARDSPHTPKRHLLVPPAGHMAGIYARTDIERGVHKAPANEVVRGIITRDLNGDRKPLEHTLNKREHDILNPAASTSSATSAPTAAASASGARARCRRTPMWKYVNVRRLFIFVEQSIDEGTQWVVFEPNAEPHVGRDAARRSPTSCAPCGATAR